jgi:sugar O-acyltransferase (sialic acid O-acetyltransferase NeuD family)
MLYIIGASGHAKVILDILHKQGKQVDGVWDDDPAIHIFETYGLLGTIAQAAMSAGEHAIIAMGNNRTREKVARQLPFQYETAIHPSANIANKVGIGAGSVVMAGVSINPDVTIGRHAILNTNCSIDHDCIIGDFAHISPNVALAGNVEVGEGTHIGIGACVIQGIKIGKWVTVGAGSVIIKDIPDGATVVGNPGKIIKTK